jgi:hypothetical protein
MATPFFSDEFVPVAQNGRIGDDDSFRSRGMRLPEQSQNCTKGICLFVPLQPMIIPLKSWRWSKRRQLLNRHILTLPIKTPA